MTDLHAPTIQQPWAHAIIHLGKRVENRSWAWHKGVGGLLAIHAGKRYDLTGDDWIRRLGLAEPGFLVSGAIIGVVTVAGMHHARTCFREALPHNTYCSPWAVGLHYHWELADPKPFDPIPCRGAQGVWRVPDDIAALIAAQREGDPNS